MQIGLKRPENGLQYFPGLTHDHGPLQISLPYEDQKSDENPDQ